MLDHLQQEKGGWSDEIAPKSSKRALLLIAYDRTRAMEGQATNRLMLDGPQGPWQSPEIALLESWIIIMYSLALLSCR